jgi:hypothetical protein
VVFLHSLTEDGVRYTLYRDFDTGDTRIEVLLAVGGTLLDFEQHDDVRYRAEINS